MMKKKTSKSTKKFAALLLLPALAVFLLAFAEPEYHYSVSVPTERDGVASHDLIVADTVTGKLRLVAEKIVANVSTVTDSMLFAYKDTMKRHETRSVFPIITKQPAGESGNTVTGRARKAKLVFTADSAVSAELITPEEIRVILDSDTIKICMEKACDVHESVDGDEIVSVTLSKDVPAEAADGEKGRTRVITVTTIAASESAGKQDARP